MKKLDWFVADRTLSLEVSEFMRCIVWKTELNLRYKAEIEKCEKGIESLDVMKGSIHEDQIPVRKAEYETRILELKAECKEEVQKQAHFEKSDACKAMERAIRRNPAQAESAILDFFMEYHLNVEDTGLVEEILNAGGEKIDNKTLVRTEGKGATALNIPNTVKMVYAKAYEHMVWAGTIKAQQIPPMMADKYTKKPKAKKSNGSKKN